MTEQETFNEWVKQLESSMAVPMYPKALLLDFMKKAFFAGLEQHSHDYLVKTKDLKANCDLAIEGRDVKIMELEKENAELKNIKDVADLIRLNNSSIVAMACLNNHNTSLHQELAQAKELLKEWAYNYGHVNELLEQKSLSFINKEIEK